MVPPLLWGAGITLTVLSRLGVVSSIFGGEARAQIWGVFLGVFLLWVGTLSVPRCWWQGLPAQARGGRPTIGVRSEYETSPEFLGLGPIPVWVGGFRWVSTPARTVAWLGGGAVVLGATLAVLGV